MANTAIEAAINQDQDQRPRRQRSAAIASLLSALPLTTPNPIAVRPEAMSVFSFGDRPDIQQHIHIEAQEPRQQQKQAVGRPEAQASMQESGSSGVESRYLYTAIWPPSYVWSGTGPSVSGPRTSLTWPVAIPTARCMQHRIPHGGRCSLHYMYAVSKGGGYDCSVDMQTYVPS